MVTISERAVQQQQQRIARQPISRTQRKRAQVIRRIPPPTIPPATLVTPGITPRTQDSSQQQVQGEYLEGKVAEAEGHLKDAQEHAELMKQRGDTYARSQALINVNKLKGRLETARQLRDYSRQGYSFSKSQISTYIREGGAREYILSKSGYERQQLLQQYREQAKAFEAKQLPPTKQPTKRPSGYGEWIDPATGVGYSAWKPMSPFHIPASRATVTKLGKAYVVFVKPPPPKEPMPLSVREYQEPTPEEKKGQQFYSEIYHKEDGAIRNILGNIKSTYTGAVTGISSLLGGRKSERDIQREVFTRVPTTSLTGPSGTAVYIEPPEETLSEEAIIYKRTLKEEPVASFITQLKFEADIQKKYKELLKKLETGEIYSPTEADKELQVYSTELLKSTEEKYLKQSKIRTEIRQQEAFAIKYPVEARFKGILNLRELKVDYGKKERDIWEKSLKMPKPFRKARVKAGVGATALVVGGYGAFRARPLKAIKTAGIYTGVSFATAGIGGAVISGTGYAAKATMGISKALRVGYGASVVTRVALAKGRYGKFEKAGEILGTELVPLTFGGRIGGYTGRRVSSKLELYTYTKMLPKNQRAIFKAQLKEAKAFYKIQPGVKGLDLSRLEQLEKFPKAQKAVVDYFAKRRRLIVGGSISQQTQLYDVSKTKRPGDIDVYVKSLLREEAKASRYARQLSKILKGQGIEAIAKKGKIHVGGEKLIEIHPYKSFLRYNIEQVAPWYRGAKSGITKTPEGIKVLRAGPQWQRKLIGFHLEPYMTGKLRLKDLPSAMTIRKSMLKTAQVQTVGTKVYYPKKLPKDILGRTYIKGLKATKIEVLRDLLPRQKALVLEHEILHAVHPTWAEGRVRRIIGMKEIAKGKPWVIKGMDLGKVRWDALTKTKHLKVSEASKIMGGEYYTPKQVKGFIPASYYKPFKQPKISGVPYKIRAPKIPTTPYKVKTPPLKLFPSTEAPYKPKPLYRKPPRITKFPYLPKLPPIRLPPIPDDPYTPRTKIKQPTIPELRRRRKRPTKKQLKKKLIPELAYIPGFAEKAIGLEATEVSVKQAQKLLEKTVTGFELKRPVKIRRKKKKK